MKTEKQKKKAAQISASDQHELIRIRRKLQGIDDIDIENIRTTFEQQLQYEGMTRIDWLRARGMESDEPTVSKVLHGKAMSKRILTEILDYLLKP